MQEHPRPAPPADDRTAPAAGDERPVAELLALAVAAPGARALYLSADKKAAGWASLAEAAASGRPYCVEPDEGLLVADGDRPGAAEAVDELARQVRAAGAEAVVVASGSAGHRHLFARLPRPERRRLAATARAAGLDVRAGKGGRIRPPLSPHPHGRPTALLEPQTPAEALAALERSATEPAAAEPLVWPELLRCGRWPAGYRGADHSGSAMVFAIARGAARDGWTVERLAEALAEPANAGGAAYRRRLERRPDAARRWLTAHVWPAAAASAAVSPTITCPADAEAELDHMRACVEAERWAGVGGATERALLLVLADEGRRLGTVLPHVSHRQAAEALGVTRQTVAAAAARLKAKGWLQVAEVGRGRTTLTDEGELVEEALGTVWRLRIPPAVRSRVPMPRAVRPAPRTGGGGIGTRDGRSHPHDAFRWRAGVSGVTVPKWQRTQRLTSISSSRMALDCH